MSNAAAAQQGGEDAMVKNHEERRAMPDPSLMALQLNAMQKDIGEVKESIRIMSEAVTRLALVEERQANTQANINRAFDRVSSLETAVSLKNEKFEERVSMLERQVPVLTAQSDTSTRWISHFLTGAVSALVMFVGFEVGIFQ